MFFKKGLREPSLIEKLSMKIPKMLEVIFYIINGHTLAEEAALDYKEQKKELGHMDQTSSSKGHDKEYRPRPGEFEGFLDHICIFHPRESTRPETMADSRSIKRRSPKSARVTSPKLIKMSTTFSVASTRMSPRESKNSQPGR
jgi:hypothetical protein